MIKVIVLLQKLLIDFIMIILMYIRTFIHKFLKEGPWSMALDDITSHASCLFPPNIPLYL